MSIIIILPVSVAMAAMEVRSMWRFQGELCCMKEQRLENWDVCCVRANKSVQWKATRYTAIYTAAVSV